MIRGQKLHGGFRKFEYFHKTTLPVITSKGPTKQRNDFSEETLYNVLAASILAVAWVRRCYWAVH